MLLIFALHLTPALPFPAVPAELNKDKRFRNWIWQPYGPNGKWLVLNGSSGCQIHKGLRLPPTDNG